MTVTAIPRTVTIMKSFVRTGFCLAVAGCLHAASGDEFRTLGADGPYLLRDHLLAKAIGQYDARRAEVELALSSPATLTTRQRMLKDRIRQTFGELPDKTPLRPVVTGTIERDGYRIEKVVYQSRPSHYVTANLYLPSLGEPPFPAALIACGHSGLGKAYDSYQRVAILMALNGIVALVYDPIGQGERRSYLSGSGNAGYQHKLDNVSSIPVGRTVVGYQAWDGVRSLDYLILRDEVDPKRIGMTGNSGGGAQTMHLMALDERIGPAAPSCHITTLERNFVIGGAGEGCQSAPWTGALGLDHPDYFTVRAPKPTIILSAEQDYKDIRFTRETFAEARRAFELLGKPERMGMFAYNDRHAFSRPRREAAVCWMRRWLLDDPAPVIEPKLVALSAKELQATRSGQVLREFDDALSVVELNLKRARELAPQRAAFWKSHDRRSALVKIRQLIGAGVIPDKPAVEKLDAIEREGMRMEKLILRRHGEPPMPALLCRPLTSKPENPATIYLDDRGKSAEARPGGAIEKLVESGQIVLSIDVRGLGETAPPPSKIIYVKGDHVAAMWSLHIGKPLLGQRVEDVFAAVNQLASLKEIDEGSISLIGRGRRAGPVALHAAALDSRITSVMTHGGIESWIADVVSNPMDMTALSQAAPDVLRHYDLPDLAQVLGDKLRAR